MNAGKAFRNVKCIGRDSNSYFNPELENNKCVLKDVPGNTGLFALDWIKKVQKLGAGEILLTSMDKDGTKSGFDTNLLEKVSEFLNIPLIASGGVGTLEHFYEGVKIGKANALLAASVFHFNEISIKEVKEYLFKKNIEIRL